MKEENYINLTYGETYKTQKVSNPRVFSALKTDFLEPHIYYVLKFS